MFLRYKKAGLKAGSFLVMERQAVVKYLNEMNWGLLDIEYIQATKSHKCIRKLACLAKNGFAELNLEFSPCKPLQKLERRYWRSYHFCQAEIHQLPYYPIGPSSPCSTAIEKLNNFITDNEIDLILYKGGDIEKKLCDELEIASFNIEYFNLEKAYSHDPYEEVNHYFIQIVESIL